MALKSTSALHTLKILSSHVHTAHAKFQFQKVLCLTSSGFSTDEGLRVSQNVLLKYTSQWQKTALLSIIYGSGLIYFLTAIYT